MVTPRKIPSYEELKAAFTEIKVLQSHIHDCASVIERNLVFCGFPMYDEPKVISDGYAVKLRYKDVVIDDRAILTAIANRGFITPYDFS